MSCLDVSVRYFWKRLASDSADLSKEDPSSPMQVYIIPSFRSRIEQKVEKRKFSLSLLDLHVCPQLGITSWAPLILCIQIRTEPLYRPACISRTSWPPKLLELIPIINKSLL